MGMGPEEQLRGEACDEDSPGRDERLKLIGLLYLYKFILVRV